MGNAFTGVIPFIPFALLLAGCIAPVEVVPGWEQALASGQAVTVYDGALSSMVIELQNHRMVLATHSTTFAVWLYRVGFNAIGIGLVAGSWKYRHTLGWQVRALNTLVAVLLVWVAGLSFDRKVEIDFRLNTVGETKTRLYGLWTTRAVVGDLNIDFARAERRNDCTARFESDVVECTESVVLVGAREFEVLSVPQTLVDLGGASTNRQREFVEKLAAFINARWPPL